MLLIILKCKIIKALFGPKKIKWKESWKEKKGEGKNWKKVTFFSLVWIREKHKEKKGLSNKLCFPCVELGKLIKKKTPR